MSRQVNGALHLKMKSNSHSTAADKWRRGDRVNQGHLHCLECIIVYTGLQLELSRLSILHDFDFENISMA